MFYQILFLLLGTAHAQSSCSHGDFRLVNTRTSSWSGNEGNVQICWNDRWLPVRYSSSSRVPGLICQQLGFSAKDYRTTTSRSWKRWVNFNCDGEETSLKACDRCAMNGYGPGIIRCADQSNDTIPHITSATIEEEGVVSLKWKLVERDELASFTIECSSVKHMARLLVNNQTFNAQFSGLVPHADYNCCVSALFDGYRVQSCAAITTTEVKASSGQSASVTRNADTVGGVLGFIIIVLLLLLILAIVALVYPCLIRPRIQNYGTLSRLSDFLDHKVYSHVYMMHTTASAKSSSKEERKRNTSTGVTSASAFRRTESAPAQGSSDDTQSYEPLNYYAPVQTPAMPTVTNTTSDVDVPRVYEPAAYTLPSSCLGQTSDTANHVYAVLEEPIKEDTS